MLSARYILEEEVDLLTPCTKIKVDRELAVVYFVLMIKVGDIKIPVKEERVELSNFNNSKFVPYTPAVTTPTPHPPPVEIPSPHAFNESLELSGKQVDVTQTLSPSELGPSKEKWVEDLDNYKEKDPKFLHRCETQELTDDDLFIICETLEASGEAGMSLDVFAAKLRILEPDFVELARKYPQVEKSIRLSRVKRKGTFLENMVISGHKSTATMRELFENENINKDLLAKEEEAKGDTAKRTDTEVAKILMEEGIVPGEYLSVVCLTGDLPSVDDIPNPNAGMAEFGYKEPDEILDEIER